MTDLDRNAVLLAAADALMNEHLDEFVDDDGYEVGWRDSRDGVKVRDAIYDALASSSASGAGRMREAAAAQAEHYGPPRDPVATIYGNHVAWRIADAIRALPLPDPAPVPAWRDIATAPHEVNVLLAWPDLAVAGGWMIAAGMASWGWRNEVASSVSHHGRATHWQPLPPPPQTDGGPA